MLTTPKSYAIFYGNGVTTVFPYTFLVQQATDLVVSITDNRGSSPVTTVLQTSQYSVTGINNPAGGNVTYPVSGSPLPAGCTITIQRIVPYQQNTSLANQGAFYPQVVEAALDYLTMQVQQLAAQYFALVTPPYQNAPLIIGDPAADGSWRIIQNGPSLEFDRLEGGVWVEKGSFDAS